MRNVVFKARGVRVQVGPILGGSPLTDQTIQEPDSVEFDVVGAALTSPHFTLRVGEDSYEIVVTSQTNEHVAALIQPGE